MKLYFIAGEDSGDLHTSNLIKALKNRLPNLHARGVGGDKMAKQGVELVAHVKDINFMGFAEVISNLSTIRKLFKTVENDIQAYQPEAVVLVDYPGFNLRMAKFIKKLGIKVIYYISPQVWAWKKGRVKKIKAYTNKMMVILPFEKEFYAKEGVEVEFVGHPLLDVIEEENKEISHSQKTIALLPGSRKQEISRMLPVMLELTAHFPRYKFVVAGAPSQEQDFYQEIIGDKKVELIMNQTYDVLRKADLAVVTSGTATLETALFKVPEVVVYKGSWFSYVIGKRLVNIDYISLVNLILGKEAVKELIQKDFEPSKVASELKKLESGDKAVQIQANYQELWRKLGAGGASEKAAESVLASIMNVPHEG